MAEQLDRRRFLRRAGVASGAAGALWVTPSVVGLDTTLGRVRPVRGAARPVVRGRRHPGQPHRCRSQPGQQQRLDLRRHRHEGRGGARRPRGHGQLGGLSDTFVVERDPLAPTTAAQVTYSHSLGTLVAGRTYTFNFSIWDRRVNQYTQELQVEVISPTATVTTIASYATGNPPAVTQLVDATTSPSLPPSRRRPAASTPSSSCSPSRSAPRRSTRRATTSASPPPS